jgi:hypothetical protein
MARISMNRKATILIIMCIVFVVLDTTVLVWAGDREKVPTVAYLSPDDETTIDLSGKTGITFKWQNAPIPGGGRASYRFKLIKGFKYDFIMSKELGAEVFSIDVPAEKFEDGITYSWYVEQRDASSMIWSLHNTVWSFKVIKR